MTHFFLTNFYYNFFMSRVENIKIQIKNAKVKSHIINEICDCFSKDFTAIQTANQTGYSRQTINHYYKIFRNKIIEKNLLTQYNLSSKLLSSRCIEIKHLNIYNHDIFYIENEMGILILDKQSDLPNKLSTFIESNIKITLINHKKANCVRILHNMEKSSYITSGYFKAPNNFEQFLYERLKKFRGINKNNFHTHLNESLFRYNLRMKGIYEEVLYSFS